MISRSRQTRSGRRHLGVAGPLSAALTALLIVAGCNADGPQPPTPPSRVLQSVAVQMTPDGTTTAIRGTAVSVRDNASDATTQNTTYSPAQVADDLPVRVSTTYRTDEKAGTDLRDLDGYTGRVEIDVTIQNLTVKPQNITYDAAGTSRTQPAMVGSPLTVVASTALPDVKPTDVITATAPGDVGATNGILSQAEDGGSVVQWAALLAAPQTGTVATLRLVSDVKDFSVPTIDLTVEPGLVTDPSVGGVIDSAFNSDPTSQLALEQRTIKVITDVNQVLTRASDNISDVRKNLDSTSKTLGTRTTEELKSSTEGVSTSMKGLDQELKSLNSDIASTLGQTQSSVLQELSQTVGTMDQMLGDTSAPPPTPVIDGNGCKTVVQDPKNAGTVYGNLMQVTAQLDGYATATGSCKKEAQRVLLEAVGPAKPSDKNCEKNKSTTCSLYYTEQQFGVIMEDLVAKGNELVNSLQPEIVTDAQDEFDEVSASINRVLGDVNDLKDSSPYAGIPKGLDDVDDSLNRISSRVTSLESKITRIHGQAVDARKEIGEQMDDETYGKGSMLAQNAAVADELCQLVAPGVLGRGQINRIRAYLVDDSCPDQDGNTHGIGWMRRLHTPYRLSMEKRLLNQADRWNKIISNTDVTDDQQGPGKDLARIRELVARGHDQVETIRQARNSNGSELTKQLTELEHDAHRLSGQRNLLGKMLAALQKQQDGLAPTINKAFNDAANEANTQVAGAIEPQIRKVAAQAQVDSRAVGDMFDQSAAGLSNASDQISRNGTRTINAQRRQLQESEKHAEGVASQQVDQALTRMAKGVSASTRDMNGASAQLTDSLKKVLLDLGTRKVNGSGLLGSMTTSAAKVGTADYQLALASTTTTSYAGVRGEDVNGILLRQAQLSAALEAGANLPAFHLTVPSGAQSQTVYTFQIKETK